MNRLINISNQVIIKILMFSSLVCVLITILAGLLSSMHYVESLSLLLEKIGLHFASLRPIHTIFSSAWLFIGGITFIFKFLLDLYGPFNTLEKILFNIQMFCFVVSGLGILISVFIGYLSGREYLGFYPQFSIFIGIGWLIFSYLFFKKVYSSFWTAPVYVYMWGVAILFFMVSFIEAHFYLFRFVYNNPIIDMQIQWKSCGSLVAAFNQIIQGSLLYLVECLGRDKVIAHSRSAFALFAIGLLNAFTNFAHHTYHIPQMHLIKWFSFIVSMLEIIIFTKIFFQVSSILNKKALLVQWLSVRFINLSKNWNICLLPFAILISIPPINTLIHGTTVVMAHAMGSEIVINSYIIFAIFSFLLVEMFGVNIYDGSFLGKCITKLVSLMNFSITILILWLIISGIMSGICSYFLLSSCFIISYDALFLLIFGGLFSLFSLILILFWITIILKFNIYN